MIRPSSKYAGFSANSLFVLLLFSCSWMVAQGQNPAKPIWYKMGSNKGFTLYEIQQDFDDYWQGREEDESREVFERWESYAAPRVYPSGDLSLLGQTYPNFLAWQREHAGEVNSRSNSSAWVELGPFGKAGDLGEDSGAGHVSFIYFGSGGLPLYIGAPDGGIWTSSNNGSTWTSLGGDLPALGVAGLAIDGGTMYVATGSREERYSIGIKKSTDGGATWNDTGLTFTPSDDFNENRRIRNMLADPGNGQTMLIITDGGIYKTTNGWTSFTYPQCCTDFKDLEFKPGDPNIVYASGAEFWRSTDKGSTWAQVTSGLPASNIGRIALGVTPANPTYVYALVAKASNNGFLGLYLSTDSGLTFTQQSTTPNILGYTIDGITGDDGKGQAFHDLAISVSEINANELVCGGVSQFKSADGGVTWAISSFWSPGNGVPFTHADIQDIAYLPGSGSTIYTTCDGGVFTSTDNGVNWTDITGNLAIAQATSIAVTRATASTKVVAGLQDIGTIYKETGNPSTWKLSPGGGGDGEYCFYDRTNNSNIVESGTDGSHQLSMGGPEGSFSSIVNAPLIAGDFISAIRQDPSAGNEATFYAGGRPAFYKSTDMGTTWTQLGTPFNSGTITEFAVAATDNQIIYAVQAGGIAKSINGGMNWTILNSPAGTGAFTHVVVANGDPNNVWVCRSGYDAGFKVFQSTNGGGTWTNKSAGLPNIPMNRLARVEGGVDQIYVAADIGVYYSAAGADFTLYRNNNDLPLNSVRDIQISYPDEKVVVGTYGRGMWSSPLADPLTPLPVELVAFDARLLEKNTAHLTWATASEANNKGFEIEWQQGGNGTHFEAAGFVPGKGNGTTTQEYSFDIKGLTAGEHYFRLKQVDNDGAFDYSPIKRLIVNMPPFAVAISPNPVNDEIVFEIFQQQNSSFGISLTNSLGQLAMDLMPERELEKGVTKLRFNLSNLPAGIYFCICKTDKGMNEAVRFVKN